MTFDDPNDDQRPTSQTKNAKSYVELRQPTTNDDFASPMLLTLPFIIIIKMILFCPVHNTIIIRRNARLVCAESGIARFLLSLPMQLGRSSMAGLPQDDQACRSAGFWMLVITLDCLSSSCLSHSRQQEGNTNTSNNNNHDPA